MQHHFTLYRVSPWSRDLKLLPKPTIKIPNQVFKQVEFRSKIADFLVGTNIELLTDKLRCVGHPIQPKCIIKRVFAQRSLSKLWFFVRVAVQLSLDRSPLGHDDYKVLMLLFMYNLAVHAVNTHLPDLLLYSMSSKILRRFRKLGSSVPQWLRDPVFRTCISLSQALDERWQDVQRSSQSSLNWDPSLLDVAKDVQHSLPHIHDYVSTSLADSDVNLTHAPFLPNSGPRGTLNNLLSDPTWLSKGRIDDDAHVTLHDVERAVGENIDCWVACITDVDEACEQLERLAHQYYSLALDTYCRKRGEGEDDVDNLSIMLLTMTDLWVALDKLVIKEIPILADYSPEIPVYLLRGLCLRDPICIQRFCRVYQYLLARHTRVHSGWSVISNKFTQHSFPCRYYDNSPHLQNLMGRIKDALPLNPLHAKVVVFELECPASFNAWRSLTYWISGVRGGAKQDHKDIQVFHIPELQRPTLTVRNPSPLLYSSPAPQYWDRLYYVCEESSLGRFKHVYKLPSGPYADSKLQQYLDITTHTHNQILVAQANRHSNISSHEFIAFAYLRTGGSLQWFNILRELRSRTLDFRRQDVYLLFAQASSQVGPLDGTGTLSWHQELQDSSFCHALLDELKSLFTDIGVGSLDGPGMAIISLLAGVLAKRHFGDVFGRAIQLLRDVRRKTFRWVHELLCEARNSPTNKKSLKLLRDMAAVCRSTFDVGSTPSRKLLCSAQDIETVLSCSMLIRTILAPFPGMSDPELTVTTIDLTLSDVSTYSQVLLDRDHRLSLILEGDLRDAIRTSDVGVDRAIQVIWPSYQASLDRWVPLQSPNSRWLVNRTAHVGEKHSQVVHVNILDGSLLVDGKQIGHQSVLPSDVTSSSMYHELFSEVCGVPVPVPL